jgi:hypothetical protein
MMYYFNLDEGHQYLADTIGKDLASNEAARAYAIHVGAHIIADELRRGSPRIAMTFEIANSAGEIIERVPLTAIAGRVDSNA